jgi:hypothetical protein
MVTPCVLRPAMRDIATVVRISLAWSVTSINCSPLCAGKLATHRPVAVGGDDVGDALAAAIGAADITKAGALAIAVGGDR